MTEPQAENAATPAPTGPDRPSEEMSDDLRAMDDADTREVPALKDEWRQRAEEVARAIDGDDPVIDGDAFADLPEQSSRTGEAVHDTLPDTEAAIYGGASEQVARAMLDLARRAQAAWRALRFEQRMAFFNNLRNDLVRNMDDSLGQAAGAAGRPTLECLALEYLPVLETLRALPDVVPPLLVERQFSSRLPMLSRTTVHVSPQPHGVVMLIAPSRPVFGPVMSFVLDALATGNAPVVVVDEERLRALELMQRLFDRAKFPRGLVQMIAGGRATTRNLIEARPDRVFFAGHPDLSREVTSLCSQQGIPCVWSLRGKNVLALLEDADPALAAHAACWAAFNGGGYFGGAAERVVVHHRIYDEFRMRFIEAVRNMNSHHAQLARVHAEDEDLRLKEILLDAMAQGARVTYPAGDNPGKFVHWRPAVIENVSDRARASREPLLAPATAIYRTEDVAALAEHLLRLCPAGVVNVMGRPDAATRHAFEQLNAPVISFNDPQVRSLSWQGSNVCGGGLAYSQAGPSYMLSMREVVESEPRSRAWWYPYADEKLRAFMLGIPGWYAAKRLDRARGVIALAMRPILWRALRRQ